MHREQKGVVSNELQSSMSEQKTGIEKLCRMSIKSRNTPQHLQPGVENGIESGMFPGKPISDSGSNSTYQRDPHGPTAIDRTVIEIEPEDRAKQRANLGKRKDQEVNEEEIDVDLEDGWDDFGFDDVDENTADHLEQQLTLSVEDKERKVLACSSDDVRGGDSLKTIENASPPCGTTHDQGGIGETRLKWRNPRPIRPYIKD